VDVVPGHIICILKPLPPLPYSAGCVGHRSEHIWALILW
jgi:hypothetical protein